MKKNTENIINILDCEYEMFENSIREIIEKKYSELYKDGKKEGFYPVIVVPSEVLYDALSVNMGLNKVKDVIESSNNIDVEKFFNSKRGYYEYIQENQVPLGRFSLEAANDYLSEYIDPDTLHPFDETLILKIPTRKPWEILGYIPMGGYNECPSPDSQIAISEYWYRKYKAVPTVITANSVEFTVNEPPQNLQDAEKLAYEHYLFCNEVVDNEVGTLRKLASLLKDSTIWAFWWD